jgi:hypothetical protein
MLQEAQAKASEAVTNALDFRKRNDEKDSA